MAKKHIISTITVLDNDHELYETYIGLDNENMDLLLSAWGKTESESRQRAEEIVSLLGK